MHSIGFFFFVLQFVFEPRGKDAWDGGGVQEYGIVGFEKGEFFHGKLFFL